MEYEDNALFLSIAPDQVLSSLFSAILPPPLQAQSEYFFCQEVFQALTGRAPSFL